MLDYNALFDASYSVSSHPGFQMANDQNYGRCNGHSLRVVCGNIPRVQFRMVQMSSLMPADQIIIRATKRDKILK